MAIKFFLGHKNGAWAFFKEKEVATWPTSGPLRSSVFFDQNGYGVPESINTAAGIVGWTEIPDVNGASGVIDVSNVRKAVINVVPSHPYTKYDLSVLTSCKVFPESSRRWSRHIEGSLSNYLDRLTPVAGGYWGESNHSVGSYLGGDYYFHGGTSEMSGFGAYGSKSSPMFMGPSTFTVDVHGVDLLTVSPSFVEFTGYESSSVGRYATVSAGSNRVKVTDSLGSSSVNWGEYGSLIEMRVGDNFAFATLSTSDSARKVVRITHDGFIIDRPFSNDYTIQPYFFRSDPLPGTIDIVSGSPVITGVNTDFNEGVSIGDFIATTFVFNPSAPAVAQNHGKVIDIDPGGLSLTLDRDATVNLSNKPYISQRTLDIYVGLIEFEDSEI